MHHGHRFRRIQGNGEEAEGKKRTEVGAAAAFQEDTDGREDDREDLPRRSVSISVFFFSFLVRSFAARGVHGGRVNCSAV